MAIILRIDPGSRLTGYGVIRLTGSQVTYLGSGCINVVRSLKGETEPSLADKLKVIHDGVVELIQQFQPTEFAIVQVYATHNPDSALKLGQGRGATIEADVVVSAPIAEYREQLAQGAVVGTGEAIKYRI